MLSRFKQYLLCMLCLGIVALPIVASAGTNTFIMPTIQLQQNQTNGTFGIGLTNQDTPSSLSIEFTYNPSIGFDVTGAALTSRTQSIFDAPAFNKSVIDATTTKIQILVYKFTSPPPVLPAGSGDILQLTYTTTASGTGSTPLTITEALLSDGNGVALGTVLTQNGSAAFPTVTKYALTVTKTGSGTGTVTSSPTGISCGTDCSETYNAGTSVTLTATPTTGSTFIGWSGACSGTSTCTVSMNAAKTATATFALTQTQYTLIVTKSGTGTGSVISSPAGISCGTDCSEAYNAGTSVTLTATPTTGSTFTGWSGACTGTGACTVAMSAAKAVTATFTLTPVQYTLTVTKAGTGTGTVTSSPAGISCGTDCSEAYNASTSVTLTSTPATGSTFTGWSGACTGTGTCTVAMTAAKTVTATFTLTPTQYTLTVTKSGTGTGTVTSSPSGISCGTDCSEAYNASTSVTLTATPTTGSTFTGWSGACTGTGACTVAMTAAKAVTATFALTPTQYTLTVTKAGTGTGTVTSSPVGISCGTDCSEAYNASTSVTLTATPATGSTFTGWSGACTGTGACTVAMNAAKAVTATFTQTPVQYTLAVTKAGTGTGTVTSSPTGISCGTDCSEAYNASTSVTLTATPATGSTFTGWSGACTGTGACTVAMDAAKTVMATFTPNTTDNYTISGRVTYKGAGLANVVMTGLPGTPKTDATGAYSATVPGGWTGTVTPFKAGDSFTPAVMNYPAVNGNLASQNYTARITPACTTRTLCNGDFSNGSASWFSGENMALTPGRSGYGVQVSFDGGNSDVWQQIPGVFSQGMTYRASAWCLADVGEECRLFLGDANLIQNPIPYENTAYQILPGNGTWQFLSATLTLSRAEHLDFYVYAKTPGSTVVYDDARLEPAPACPPKTVCNGEFEFGLSKWSSTENATLVPGRTGTGVRVTADTNNSDIYQFMKPNAKLSANVFPAGKWYQATAWCKAEVGADCGMFLGDANTLYNPPAYQREVRRFFKGTGAWQQISVELYLDKPEILSVYLYAPTPGKAAIYDDVLVRELPSCPERTLCNGDFEWGYAQWISPENVNLIDGRNGVGALVSNDAGNSDLWLLLPGTFKGGTTYRATAWCLADVGEECRLMLGDANTTNGAPYENVAYQILPGNGQWQKLSATLTLTHDERLDFYVYAKYPKSQVLYDDLALESLQPHLLWNRGTTGQAQSWTVHPPTSQTLETQAFKAATYWQAVHYQWYHDGTTSILWRYKDGRGKISRIAVDGKLISEQVYGPLTGWKAASYQRQSDGTALLLWSNATGSGKVWLLNAAGANVSELNYGPLAGWQVINYQRNADGSSSLLWKYKNGQAMVWLLNAQGALLTQSTYGPVTGWQPMQYQRYDDGTGSLLWRNAKNGQGMVWKIGADGQKASELRYGPLSGWQAAAYIQTPQVPQTNVVNIWKTGSGKGTVTVGSWVCSTDCAVLRVPVISGTVQNAQAIPDANSTFAGWQNVNGEPLTGLQYLKAGEAVFGVFNLK